MILLPNEIVLSDKTPRTAVAFDKTSGVKQIADTARSVMLVGSQLSTATVAVSTPQVLTREDDAAILFGPGSMLDIAARAAFKANPFAKLNAVGVAEAGVKAAGTVTFVGNAGISTVYRLRIAGKPYSVDVTIGDTPTLMATGLAAKINADKNDPVTATTAAGVVTITATHGGTVGNGIQLRGAFDALAALVVTTATLSGASLASGTGSADISLALAACTGARYNIIACLLDDATAGAAAKAHVISEGDAEHDHGEEVIQVLNSNLSAQTTLALAMNNPRGVQGAIQGSETWSVAACAAMASAMSAKEIATVPYNRMTLLGVLPPPIEKRWSRTETRALLDNGVTPLFVKPGEDVAIMRAVVTEVKNSAGDFDYSTLDVTKIEAFDFIRDNIVLMFETNYPNARWADSDPDGLLPPDVATPEKVRIDLINVMRDMESLGIVQNVSTLEDQFVVEKVGTNCRFSVPAGIVDGMHERLGKVVYFNRPLTA